MAGEGSSLPKGRARSGDATRNGNDPGRATLEDIVEQAAFRWEAVISAGRALFCVAILVRSLVTVLPEAATLPRVGPEIPLLLGIIAFSVWTMARTRTRRATDATLVASVVVDAVGCFLALLLNVLTPWADYAGILTKPDPAAILVVTMAAGFRLSSRAAWVACAVNGLTTAALLAVDMRRNGPALAYGANDILLFAVFLLTTMAVAVVLSTRIRSLVRRAGAQRIEAERAQHSLFEVLANSHEMRSAISAVVLETDLFLRAAETPDSALGRDDMVRVGSDLRKGLDRLHALVASVREKTYAELAAQQGAMDVAVDPVLEAVATRLRSAHPATTVTAICEDPSMTARIVGGTDSLDRILSNLLFNACEGDGEHRATRVAIAVRRMPARVAIVIQDDGPGFSPEVLASAGRERIATTKARGSGIGLFLVRTTVSASGGSLTLRNAAGGGAEASIELPSEDAHAE